MSKLEELKPSAAIRGILPDSLVTVVSTQGFGFTQRQLVTLTTLSGLVQM